MQQRRAGEVVVRRLEVGARVHQRGIRREQFAQSLEVAGIQRGEAPRRTAGAARSVAIGLGQLDAVLQLRPAVEAVLARDDELRVGERRAVVSRTACERLALESGMMRGDARGGRGPAVTMLLMELVRLDLELSEIRTRR